jgi:uncharacterized protein (TIGR02001 family)
MSKMKVMVAGSALGAAILAVPSFAGVTGNIGVTSEYMFRGITSSDGAAVQGGLDWTDGAGLYAGVWASNTSPTVPAVNITSGNEFDLYGGYKLKVSEGVELDLGAIYYHFSEQEQVPGFESTSYPEIYAGVNVGGFSGKIYYTNNFFNVDDLGAPDSDSTYINLAYTHTINEGLTLKGAIGKQSGDGAEFFFGGQEPVDYSLTLTKALDNGFAASFGVVDTDIDDLYGTGVEDDLKFVVTLAKGFDL